MKFIANDFNNIAYTLKQAEHFWTVGGGEESLRPAAHTVSKLKLKRRVAQRHLPLIKFDGHLGNCAGAGLGSSLGCCCCCTAAAAAAHVGQRSVWHYYSNGTGREW